MNIIIFNFSFHFKGLKIFNFTIKNEIIYLENVYFINILKNIII